MSRKLRIALLAAGLALAAGPRLWGQETGFLGKSAVRWADDLDSRDARTRRGACFALGRMGPEAFPAVPELIGALRDREASVREAAAFALGEIGPAAGDQALPLLLRLLSTDGDAHVRRSSAFALGNLGPRAVAAGDALRHALRLDPKAEVRQNAAWALGRLGPNLGRAAVADLSSALSDRDVLVRRDAAAALGETGAAARAAIPLLLARFRDAKEDGVVRKTALNALVNVVGPEDRATAAELAPVLNDADPENVRAAALALGNIGGPEAAAAVPALRQGVRDEDQAARLLATAALANIGPDAAPAVPELRRALEDYDPAIRRNAALALSRVGPKAEAAVPDLAKALEPTQPTEVRLFAAEALARVGEARDKVVPILLRVLKEDTEPRVRQRAVWALGQVEDFEGLHIAPAFEAALSETAPDAVVVRYEAARFLALRLGPRAPEKALDVLLAMLEDNNLRIYTRSDAKVSSSGVEARGGETRVMPNVTGDARCLPAEALARVGSRLKQRQDIIKSLKEAARAADSRVRDSATYALKQIGVSEPEK